MGASIQLSMRRYNYILFRTLIHHPVLVAWLGERLVLVLAVSLLARMFWQVHQLEEVLERLISELLVRQC